MRPWHHNRFLSALVTSRCFSFRLYFFYFFCCTAINILWVVLYCISFFFFRDWRFDIYVIYHVFFLRSFVRTSDFFLFFSFHNLLKRRRSEAKSHTRKIVFTKNKKSNLEKRILLLLAEQSELRERGFKSPRKIGKINLYCACWMCMSRAFHFIFSHSPFPL